MRVGELVVGKVDLAMMHDSGGLRRVVPMLAELGACVWDRDEVVVASDHFVPAVDAESAKFLKITRDWVRIKQVNRFQICRVFAMW